MCQAQAMPARPPAPFADDRPPWPPCASVFLPFHPVRPKPWTGSRPQRPCRTFSFSPKASYCVISFFSGSHSKCERKIVFRDELLVRGFAVRRNTQNDDVSFLEFTHQVTEFLGFLGSPGRVVLGVKEQDDVFTPEVFQGHLVAVLIRQCECRCGLAFLNCHGTSFPFL